MKIIGKRITALFVIAAYMCLLLAIPVSAAASASDVIKQTKPGVVKLFVIGYLPSGEPYAACVGSGFGVGKAGSAPEYIVTNWHVAHCEISDGGNTYYFDKDLVRIWVMLDGFTISNVSGTPSEATAVECEIVRSVESGYPDYAILKAARPLKEFTTLPIVSSENAEQGDTVIALGCPGIVDDVSRFEGGSEITTTVGTVSRHMTMAAAGNTKVLAHTAEISGGNSGGPLVNMNGQVIGLNTYGVSDGTSSTYSIAIYSDYIMSALDMENIPYTTGKLIGGSGITGWSAAGSKLDMRVLAVGAAVIIAAAGFLVFGQKKKSNGRPAPKSSPIDPVTSGGFQVRMPDGKIVSINKTKVLVGRGSDCAIRFPEDKTMISHRHCSLEDGGEFLILADEGSRNGTYVHGKKIPDGKKVALKHGSSFSVGTEENKITVL